MLSFTHRDDVGGDGKDNGREVNFTNTKINIFVVTCLNDVTSHFATNCYGKVTIAE